MRKALLVPADSEELGVKDTLAQLGNEPAADVPARSTGGSAPSSLEVATTRGYESRPLAAALRSGERAGIGFCLMSELESLPRMARAAEEAGVASVWVGEYFQSPFVRLALVAAATHRVILGTQVAQAWARSPLASALAAAELQTLSAGRMVLGLGGQVPVVNRKWHGVNPAPNLADLREYVAAVRAILETGGAAPVRLDGSRVSVDLPAYPSLGPLPPPSIAVGGAGPKSIALAAVVGDGVLGHLFASPDGMMATVNASAAAEGGRAAPPATIARLVAPASVAGWELDAAHQLAMYALTPTYEQYLAASGIQIDREKLLTALRSDDGLTVVDLCGELLAHFCVSDVATVEATLGTASAAGIASVIFVAPYTKGTSAVASAYESAALSLFREVRDQPPQARSSSASRDRGA